MDAYYDTGVLLKLYLYEPESARTSRFVTARKAAIHINDLHLTESLSAIQLKAFRKEFTEQQASDCIAALEDDIKAGVLRMSFVSWGDVWIRCHTLVRTHAARLGTRTQDTLHVALALTLMARNFITMDKRQAALAKACGLTVLSP